MVWPKTHQKGKIAAIDSKALGFNLIHLGAGRSKVADGINPWVGLKHTKKIGDVIEPGEPLGQIYGKSQQECLALEAAIFQCYQIVDPSLSVVKPPLILKSGL
jgi:thymidine phosphorylase